MTPSFVRRHLGDDRWGSTLCRRESPWARCGSSVHASRERSTSPTALRSPTERTFDGDRLTVEGLLNFTGARVRKLMLERSKTGTLELPAEWPPEAEVNLARAHTEHLVAPPDHAARDERQRFRARWPWHDPPETPGPYRPHLAGFVYTTITSDRNEPPEPDDKEIERRIAWVHQANGNGHVPANYDQLSTVLRASGREDAARRVAIAKFRHRRATLSHPWRALSWIFDVTARLRLQAGMDRGVVRPAGRGEHARVPGRGRLPVDAAHADAYPSVYAGTDHHPDVYVGTQTDQGPTDQRRAA